MLIGKDYCDKDTGFALRELGYNPFIFYDDGAPAIHLWYAQKFLREEKGVIVEVFVDDDSDTPITYNIHKDGECICHHHGMYWSVKEWNVALLEGIKKSVKILKGED